jgi:nicotinamide mononucleotide transporter
LPLFLFWVEALFFATFRAYLTDLNMSFLEFFAAALGLVSVWMVVRRVIWAFPIGIVMVLLYAWVFFQKKLYSDVLLQFFFAGMQVQGWVAWHRNARQQVDQSSIAVRDLSPRQWWLTFVLQGGGTWLLGSAMARWTDAAVPYFDAFAAVMSMLAQWWMNQRYTQNWLLWIAVDALYLYIYSRQGLYLTTGLYAIFLVMAVLGYREWRSKAAVQTP